MTNFEKYKEGVNCSEIPNSSDSVSRQTAVEAIANQSRFSAEEIINICDKSVQDENGWLGGLKEAIQAVIELPSVQSEIIICLDCVHYEPLGKEKAWGRCSVHSSPTDNQRFVQSCDFCAWAERKTDD